MAVLLAIETSGELCSVALFNESKTTYLERSEKNVHAAALTGLINELLKNNHLYMKDLDAICVSMGPGSYTGLRVGVSTAKGLCYALDRPLIAVGTLDAIAHGFKMDYNFNSGFICPMIDAKRMEVYAQVFDPNMKSMSPARAEILSEYSFDELKNETTAFIGNGAGKMSTYTQLFNKAKYFPDFVLKASHMVELAKAKFEQKELENTSAFEPFYLKDFFTTIKA